MFFLLGCARSGTTSLCRILNMAANAVCAEEPAPQMHRECRLHWEGRLPRPEWELKDVLLPRAREAWRLAPIYGEKNVTLSVFAEELVRVFSGKLIYITRDGRNCVASMRDWHQRMFGNFYREARQQPPLEARAQAVIDSLPTEDDLSDYGRPRPLPTDPWHERWPRMSHHEMLCWYWNAWNIRILDQLERLPGEMWRRVDYCAPDLAEQIMEAVDFLQLEGIRAADVEKMLELRINSISQRLQEHATPSTWKDWTDAELAQFWEICTPAMGRLGYYTPTSREGYRWTPDFGRWWMGQEVLHDFFEMIYNDRLYQHEAFYAWARPLLEKGEVTSALEVACGHGIGYADFFSALPYIGVDISPKEIAWCRDNRQNPKHQWICADFLRQDLSLSADLVFCQGTIENLYDMDGLLRRMASCSKKYIYVAGFYGFNDDISEHEYKWVEAYASYSNQFSLPKARAVLQECGFDCLEVRKVETYKPHNPTESIIIAKRNSH